MSTLPDSAAPVPRFRYDHAIVVLITALALGFPQVRIKGMFSSIEPSSLDVTQGSGLRQAVYGACLLLALLLAWAHQRQILRTFRNGSILLTLFVGLCLASSLWSPYPVVTVKRFILLATLLIIGLICAMPGLRTAHLRSTLLGTLTVLLALSAVMAIVLPQYGVDYQLNGAWRGILWQKNILGAAAAFGVIIWFDRLCNLHFQSIGAWLGFSLATAVLVMSKSSTSLVSTIAALGLYVAIRHSGLLRSRITALLGLAAVGILLLALHVFYTLNGHLPTWETLTNPVTAAVGKGADFTGRTGIWRMLWISIDQHPWFGGGYGAFWVGEGGPAQYIADAFHWMPPHGHSGYLDILNELGAAGLVLLILIVLSHLYKLILLSQFDQPEAALHVAFLALLLISNTSESHLMYGTTFQNCIFIFSVLIVSNSLHAHIEAARMQYTQPAAACPPVFQ